MKNHPASIKSGKAAEKDFELAVSAWGAADVVKATGWEDSHEHWDYACTIGGERVRIEVKAMKAIKRGRPGGPTYQQNRYFWIEYRTVVGAGRSHPGWIFGRAHLIATDMGNEFWLLDRRGVVDWFNRNVDVSRGITHEVYGAFHCLYERTDGGEARGIMTLALASELAPFVVHRVPKVGYQIPTDGPLFQGLERFPGITEIWPPMEPHNALAPKDEEGIQQRRREDDDFRAAADRMVKRQRRVSFTFAEAQILPTSPVTPSEH